MENNTYIIEFNPNTEGVLAPHLTEVGADSARFSIYLKLDGSTQLPR